MQVEIVRHHGRAQNGDGGIEAPLVEPRHEAGKHADSFRLGHENFRRETDRNDADQPEDDRFEIANAEFLQPKHEQRIERRECDRDQQRNMEQQIQRNGRAQHFRQVAGDDGDFTQEPERQINSARIGFAAGLGQIAARDDAEARAQRLQQHRHGVGHHEHPQQPVAEVRAAIDVGRPVAGVHVADADEVGRAGEGQHAAKGGNVVGGDALMHIRERPALGWVPGNQVEARHFSM